MILPIVKYGHPVLRQKGLPIDPAMKGLEKIIEDMLETMNEAGGIGLAAHQISKGIQLTVIDVSDVETVKSAMWIDDHEVEIHAHMPMILINPKITLCGNFERAQEGCLSFPEIYGEVNRQKRIEVSAFETDGGMLNFECEGLLSRAVQHEIDHLNGILFIDRMDALEREKIRSKYEALHAQTQKSIKK